MARRPNSEIQIDVVAECACCSFEGLDWSSFLEHFDSDTHRPQPGKPVPLVIRFSGSNARGPKGKADKAIRRIQQRIAESGNARLLDGVTYQSTGFFSHACGSMADSVSSASGSLNGTIRLRTSSFSSAR